MKWLVSWRTARRLLIGIAVIVTLYALYCTEENIRGKHAWDKYRQELEARGEQLDFKAFIPKPVPDDQNFAATPVIQSWFPRQDNSQRWKDNYSRAENIVKADKDHRGIMDLVAWGRAFENKNTNGTVESGPLDRASRAKAVPRVLEVLKTNEAVFAELRAVSERPDSRYPIDYSLEDPAEIRLPHLGCVRNVCKRLQLKACAELAVGRSADALEDVKLILRLADSVKGEPILITYLVRIACLQHAIQPIWEGLAEHAWSEAQLQELQTRLQSYDFVAELKRSLDAERSWGIPLIDFVRKRGVDMLIEIVGPGQPTPLNKEVADVLNRVIPSGWFYLEQINYCRLFELQATGTYDVATKRVFPNRVQANGGAVGRVFAVRNPFSTILLHHRLMSTILLPALGKVSTRFAVAQIVADQAALACALERYRLANAQFPETLDVLVPQFTSQLPDDVITGEPYKYRRTEAGQFMLYSVGWNEKDDGGVPGKTLFDEKEGDWVWQYPAPQ